MHTIFKTEFGSVVYGTNLPTSDKDYKSIFLPSAKDIVLQKAARVITQNTKTDTTAKNTAEDVDNEAMSLQYFLKLLTDGQTPMVDMLFAPEKHWQTGSWIWNDIKFNKNRLVTKRIVPIIGYINVQAAKYGIKGSRMAAVKNTIDMLTPLVEFKPKATLNEYKDLVIKFIENEKSEHITLNMIDEKTKGIKPYLHVCGRNAPFNGTVRHALEMFQKVYEQYGHRAQQAKDNKGVDWKACYHAVRIAKEAEELLLTHNITFPRPEAQLLLQIRKGELPYYEVQAMIEQGLEDVIMAQGKSTLREEPDLDWVNDFVFNTYLEVIRGGK